MERQRKCPVAIILLLLLLTGCTLTIPVKQTTQDDTKKAEKEETRETTDKASSSAESRSEEHTDGEEPLSSEMSAPAADPGESTPAAAPNEPTPAAAPGGSTPEADPGGSTPEAQSGNEVDRDLLLPFGAFQQYNPLTTPVADDFADCFDVVRDYDEWCGSFLHPDHLDGILDRGNAKTAVAAIWYVQQVRTLTDCYDRDFFDGRALLVLMYCCGGRVDSVNLTSEDGVLHVLMDETLRITQNLEFNYLCITLDPEMLSDASRIHIRIGKAPFVKEWEVGIDEH